MSVALMHGDDPPHGFTPAERISNAQRDASALQSTGLQCIEDLTIPVDPPSPQPTPTDSSPQRPLQAHLRPSSPFSLSSTLDVVSARTILPMLPLVYYVTFQLSQPLQIAINAALAAAASPADSISLQTLRSNEPAGMWLVVPSLHVEWAHDIRK